LTKPDFLETNKAGRFKDDGCKLTAGLTEIEKALHKRKVKMTAI
jgi:hypothetical protein